MLSTMDGSHLAAPAGDAEAPGLAPMRAQIYHFLETALAHPGEDGFAYFAADDAERALLLGLGGLRQDALLDGAREAFAQFFRGLRACNAEQAEAAHIALFSANFPVVPCPPYGSLFTVEEPKRLEEMIAIKRFYHECGLDIAGGFDDLPDHVCVELEFMQLMTFREATAADRAIADALRFRQARFVDRFLQPFVDRLAALALRFDRDNPYAHLVEATRLLVAHHRAELGPEADESATRKGRLS